MRAGQEKDQRDKQGTISKKNFETPKLKFIEPKLKTQGNVTKITGQFFGPFSP